MKKIFQTLVMLTILACAVPTYGSQVKMCSITGGACSVPDMNIERSKIATDDKYGLKPLEVKQFKDLRPVKVTLEKSKIQDVGCLFGPCLYRTILGK